MRIMRYALSAIATVLAVLVTASLVAPDAMAHVVAHAAPDNPVFASFLRSVATIGVAAKGVSLAMYGPLLHLKPKRYADLVNDSKPPTSDEPEYFPMTWYDSVTYTSATTVGTANLFAQTNADQSLSNMQLAGQFPAGEYFDLGEIHCDILERSLVGTAPAATNPAVGNADDIAQLVASGRTLVQFNWRNKAYGPWPLALFRPLGYLRGVGVGFTGAATTQVTYAGWEGVGCMFEKTLTIAPTSKFGITVTWPATALTLSGNPVLRFTLRGVHYRTVN